MQKFSIPVLLYYLDDDLNVTSPNAKEQLGIKLDVFRYLGIPVAKEKTSGPSPVLPFLGIELDTVLFEACFAKWTNYV